MNYSYDELYGITIDEYCKRHNTTIEEIIQKIKIDLKILHENLGVLLEGGMTSENYHLVDTVVALERKKEKHIARLAEWAYTKGE